ncbi:PREDICTED: zinc-finger homeodomain protein 2-like [Ipomoea nil]|uniref:zinc-finger homeodomain protein 2-like n=1 Tax=Ipomoea nil TaxID=35883 RepID=UPI000901AB92|nr:PREDICTED: zinc-finger homeodomain protein 2-like [Ipomoea nil]
MDNTNELYKECLRNHAASLGSYATDGCGEFTPDDTSPGGAASLQCAACGCHRNFHRKVAYGRGRAVVEDHDMMMTTTTTPTPPPPEMIESPERSGKKRFRTKFTAEQKEKMLAFAEKLGWKLQRKEEEDEIERFCRGVGVSRKVFKVWMHNHKNNNSSTPSANVSSLTQ